MSFTEICNDDYWKEKRRQKERSSPSAPPPRVLYFLHGSGLFVSHQENANILMFDPLKKSIYSNAARDRDDFIGSIGNGQLRNDIFSDKYIIHGNGITQERIDFIYEIGGTITLWRATRDFPEGRSLPLFFYFISNGFFEDNE